MNEQSHEESPLLYEGDRSISVRDQEVFPTLMPKEYHYHAGVAHSDAR